MRGQRKNPRKAVQPFENKKRKIDIFKNYEANGVEKIQRKLEIFSTLISKKSTLGLFIAIEGLVLFYLKKDIEILKSNKQTFANSSPEERIELFLYSKKDEETLELEKKLQRQIASNDRYIKRLKNRLQKSQEISKNGKRCASQI